MTSERRETRTGGRAATTGVIPGRYALAVGRPDTLGPVGWEWRPLSELARLESGHTPSRKKPEYWDGDIPWVGIRDATGNHGRRIDDTAQHTNELGIENSSARILPPNTVCLSRTASVGYVVVMGREMATSQDFVNWVCSEDLDWRYLKYVLLAEHESVKRFAHGTTHQTVYFPEVKAFHILAPPLDEQQQIAQVLSALDDKIESNRRIAKTLEEIVAELFKARFVDFVGHDDLVESELGPIPRGWAVVRLDQAATVLTRGRAPVYIDEGGTMVLNQKCVRGGRVLFEIARRHDEQSRSTDDRRVEIADVLVNSTGVGTLGRVSQVRWLPEPATVDGHVTLVRGAASEIVQDYLALSLMSRQAELERMAHGSTGQTELTRARLAQMPILVPPRTEQDLLQSYASPVREKIGTLERESLILSKIRDALLPRLISGDIRVGSTSTFASK